MDREGLRKLAVAGERTTITGGAVGGAGLVGYMVGVPYAEYAAIGGGVCIVAGLVLYTIPTMIALRRNLI